MSHQHPVPSWKKHKASVFRHFQHDTHQQRLLSEKHSNGPEILHIKTRAIELMERRDYQGAEALLSKSLQLHPYSYAIRSTFIKLYAAEGRLDLARSVFDKSKGLPYPDIPNAMIESYAKSELDKAKEIFEFAVRSGIANRRTYYLMTESLYLARRYDEIAGILKDAPEPIAGELILLHAEAMRKMGFFQKAQEIAESFLSENNLRPHSEEYTIQARVILAQCAKERSVSYKLFLALKTEIPRSSIHYPRILCQCVFTSNGLSEREVTEYSLLLEGYLLSNNGHIRKDIEDALRYLSGMRKKFEPRPASP